MNVEEMFGFLVKDYGLTYKFQEFENCYDGNWTVFTYSFYNDDGCFTIHYLVGRDELDFYYSSRFSSVREELRERQINVYEVEPNIWRKHQRIWIFKRPFFWWSMRRILNACAEALKLYLAKGNDLFDMPLYKT